MANTVFRALSLKRSKTKPRDIDPPSAPFDVAEDTYATRSGGQESFSHKLSFDNHRDVLPERPRTAGDGIRSRKRIENKLQTRDDLLFNPLGSHRVRADLSSRRVETSLADRVDAIMSPSNTASPGYALEDPELEIGTALGSPNHPPTPPKVQVQLDREVTVSPESFDSVAEWKERPKAKAGKWNLFGRFGKKAAPTFYQLQPEVIVHEVNCAPLPPLPEEKPWSRMRMNSLRSPKLSKPKIKRSQTLPSRGEAEKSPASSTPNTATTPNSSMPVTPATPAIRVEGPMLDVTIPSIEMERYSIMFGSVLQKPSSSASSLLARRQATLDRLKTVNEAIAAHERRAGEDKGQLLRPRRASSPQPTKSPSFSLFPASNTGSHHRDASPFSTRSSSTLHRSNTSPAALSPARQTFLFPDANDLEDFTPPPSLVEVPIMLAPTPPLLYSSTTTHLTLSPVSESHELSPITESYPAPPIRPSPLPEPEWEMIHPLQPAPLRLKSKSSLSKAPKPAAPRPNRSDSGIVMDPGMESDSSATVPISVSVPAPAPATEEDFDDERLMREKADVSIARQISISRRQRLLLVPINAPSRSASLRSPAGSAPRTPCTPGEVNLGAGGLKLDLRSPGVVERLLQEDDGVLSAGKNIGAKVPVVVDVDGHFEEEMEDKGNRRGRERREYRKSERVVVEED